MFDLLSDFANRLLGLSLDAGDLGLGHMAWRTVIVFAYGVLLARIADRRVLGHNAGFDIVLLVVLGSVLSRAINGQAAFLPSLVASALLVALHHVMGSLACRYHWFSVLVKGRPHVLVRDGRANEREMRRNNITGDDLDENLRLNGNVIAHADVAEARLERNGGISVVRAIPAGRDAHNR